MDVGDKERVALLSGFWDVFVGSLVWLLFFRSSGASCDFFLVLCRLVAVSTCFSRQHAQRHLPRNGENWVENKVIPPAGGLTGGPRVNFVTRRRGACAGEVTPKITSRGYILLASRVTVVDSVSRHSHAEYMCERIDEYTTLSSLEVQGRGAAKRGKVGVGGGWRHCVRLVPVSVHFLTCCGSFTFSF